MDDRDLKLAILAFLVKFGNANPSHLGFAAYNNKTIMKTSVFIATSLDGFIAREDGAIDWLPSGGEAGNSEDYGYQAFFDSVDAIVMGRHTFELILSFPEWPYGDKTVIVLSSQFINVPPFLASKTEVTAAAPTELCQRLVNRGVQHLYVDGGKTIQGFLRAGLIDQFIIAQVPILIGKGLPLFGAIPQDIKLQLMASRAFPNGVVQSQYAVLK